MLAAAILLAMLIVQLALPLPEPTPADAGGLALRLARPVAAGEVVERPAILAAAVFAPDRRPVAAVSGDTTTPLKGGGAAGPSQPAGLDAYAVLGSASVGRSGTALIRGPGGLRTVRAGDRVAGWRVAAVGRDGVRFSMGGRSRFLEVGAGGAAAPEAAEPDAAEVDPAEEPEE